MRVYRTHALTFENWINQSYICIECGFMISVMSARKSQIKLLTNMYTTKPV